MSISDLKNCSDCVNCIAEMYQLNKCKRKINKTVFGQKVFAFCVDERNYEIGECGEQGKFFEQKEINLENDK